MLPAAVAVAMAGFIGAFGSSVPAAHAIEGDIYDACTSAPHSYGSGVDGFDGQGNNVYVVHPGQTQGLVFIVEDGVYKTENNEIRIDSETGSARITSKAEWVGTDDGDVNVDHTLVSGWGTDGVGTQSVDTFDINDFNDPDGNELDDVGDWLKEVAGMPDFFGECDYDSSNDAWGFIDFKCIESGYFHIDILSPDDTEETGKTLKFYCVGQAESATISVQRSTVETQPTSVAPNGFGTSTVTVTVEDQFGDRIDFVDVSLTTDNCTFIGDGGDDYGHPATSDYALSPAGGGQTVTVMTDTDSSSDDRYLQDNPLEHAAGTAEAVLDCTTSKGSAGVAHITAIVQREGSDIVLSTTVTVVGPTSATGLTLTLTPEDIECGEVILATVSAVDANGAPVSNGTWVSFTTDTSSGVVGGSEGAQGDVQTLSGQASVHIATDPGNPGIHTVIAYIENSAGTPSAQDAATYTCDAAVAPAAPTVAAPATGTGTGSITPPNTGDAGLATGTTSASLFVIVGAAFAVIAGVVAFRPRGI
jgi:hypothetical protein